MPYLSPCHDVTEQRPIQRLPTPYDFRPCKVVIITLYHSLLLFFITIITISITVTTIAVISQSMRLFPVNNSYKTEGQAETERQKNIIITLVAVYHYAIITTQDVRIRRTATLRCRRRCC